jgi:hypothetical protein
MQLVNLIIMNTLCEYMVLSVHPKHVHLNPRDKTIIGRKEDDTQFFTKAHALEPTKHNFSNT